MSTRERGTRTAATEEISDGAEWSLPVGGRGGRDALALGSVSTRAVDLMRRDSALLVCVSCVTLIAVSSQCNKSQSLIRVQ